MKPLRFNKTIGLSIGERSLLAAEVVGGEKPEVSRLAEFVYPDGISPQTPAELGVALGTFLRDNKFTAKAAVVGLPARWLVVKAKEVPPADPFTLANLLRLQAEGEFSSELKDLVYDYAADTASGHPKSVLLVATAKKYVDAAAAICEAAKLSAAMVTSSAIALGTVTGRSVQSKNPLVLLVSPAGAELTAQCGSAPSAIRHLRGPGLDRPFVGELRRAISGIPLSNTGSVNGSPRELVLWDAAGSSAFDSAALGESLGLTVRSGDLPIFGIEASVAASNGEGRKFAAAVALALLGLAADTPSGSGLGSILSGASDRFSSLRPMLGMLENHSPLVLRNFVQGLQAHVATGASVSPPVDFLHSRLAPVKAPKVPRWVVISSIAAVLALALGIWAYTDLQGKKARLANLNAQLNSVQSDVTQATTFVDKVSFAQAWHIGSPRYLACMRDLTLALPQDGQTYATSVTLKEDVPPVSSNDASASAPVKPVSMRTLSGRLDGKTTSQERALQVVEQLKQMPKSFLNVKLGSTQVSGRGQEVSFSVTFTYVPPKATP